ncbi:MAG: cell division protein FtsZ [Chloroflexota bacterium]|nr:MAG: cell division protein FtsZ [Chloroflexota bacterium]
MMPLSDMDQFARIKVIGVGGGGSNSVSRMIRAEVRGIECIAVNTDAQALARTDADTRIHIGDKLTRGLGAGGDPQKGMKAAEETSNQLFEALKDSDMVFITAGMGGGTGSGAAPVIAQIASEMGALTVAIVTKPFSFEGRQRMRIAEESIELLRDKVDALIVIPNDRIIALANKTTSLEQSFKMVDEVLHDGIQGIAEIITLPGLINVDFNDIKAIMTKAGSALMSIGRGTGENRAADAARAVISNPLLEAKIDGARGILFNITGGPDMTMQEVHEASMIIHDVADPDANVIFGAAIDPNMENEIRITAVATGFTGTTQSIRPGGLTSIRSPLAGPSTRADAGSTDVPSFIRPRAVPATPPTGPQSRPSDGGTGSTASENAGGSHATSPGELPEFLRTLRPR